LTPGPLGEGAQAANVDRQRIALHDVIAGRDLQQGELRVVAPLTVELCVECVGGRAVGRLDEGVELPLVGDPAEGGWIGRSRYGSIPVEMGSPASIQAVVPPATLTASTPRDPHNSGARPPSCATD